MFLDLNFQYSNNITELRLFMGKRVLLKNITLVGSVFHVEIGFNFHLHVVVFLFLFMFIVI